MPNESDTALGILTACQRCSCFWLSCFLKRGTTVAFLIRSFPPPLDTIRNSLLGDFGPSSNLFSGHLVSNNFGFHYQSAQSFSGTMLRPQYTQSRVFTPQELKANHTCCKYGFSLFKEVADCSVGRRSISHFLPSRGNLERKEVVGKSS